MEGQGSYQLHLSEGFLDTSSGVTVALYAEEQDRGKVNNEDGGSRLEGD